MKKYFNINFEFNHKELEKTIEETSLQSKGYCCFVDHTLLVTSFKEKEGNLTNILNNALANSCDGSYIAMMTNLIYKKRFSAYNGPELFNKYIYFNSKHCVIGNKKEVFDKIVHKVSDSGVDSSNFYFIPLPYLAVHQFDYDAIAEIINKISPRFIWVSLGAPKQEEFMYRITPKVDKGVLLGVGAALNYFSGEVKDIPRWAKKYHLIWVYRIFTEPKKQLPRCINTLIYYPVLFFNEILKKK